VDLDLVFFGTSGSVPTAQRAPSALLLRRGGERLLFDCGEGTQRQMLRSSIGLVELMAKLNRGEDFHGRAIDAPGKLHLVAALVRDGPHVLFSQQRELTSDNEFEFRVPIPTVGTSGRLDLLLRAAEGTKRQTTRIGSVRVIDMSGIRPHLTSITDSLASGVAILMSAASAICSSPPKQFPCTAAITGTGSLSQSYAVR
jgi:hypothetical protein